MRHAETNVVNVRCVPGVKGSVCHHPTCDGNSINSDGHAVLAGNKKQVSQMANLNANQIPQPPVHTCVNCGDAKVATPNDVE